MDPAELSLPADEKEAWLIRTEATIYNPLPVVEKWRFVRNLVAQYLDLYKAEKARDKWDKKVVPLLIKITDAVSALTPLLTYEPDNPRRDRTTSIEEWMGTLLEDVERRIANSIALIDHMSKLSFIARRMSSAKQLDHLVAEYTDNFRYYRGKIQSDLLYYFEPDFADSEPLRWKKTGWFDAFREPQIVRRMMEFLQSRGVDQNRLTDAQIVSEVEAFYDHLQQNGESGSLDSLPKTAADRSHFAREACALLRTHFPHQTEAMAARLGKLDDATIFTAFQEDPQFVTSIVTAIIDSDEAKKTAAQLRDRAAQCFLDILQMVIDLSRYYSPNTYSRHQSIMDRLRKLSIKICKASDSLPTSLFIKGIQVKSGDAIAWGGFSDIFRGSYRGVDVALKRIRIPLLESKEWMLRQEALIWRSLKHPNVLPFYGVDRVSLTYPFLVSPWLRRGSLSNYMKHTSAQLDHASLIGKICDGLEYLHSRDVVHGDIRAGNVLLTNNMEPRLADLGLATLSNATASANPNDTPGSTRWMAPELLRAGQPHSKESDIYAVGCTIIELYTRKPPFSDIPLDLRVMIMVYEGQRPHRPLAGQCIGHPMTDDVWRLVDSCLSSEPRKRPLPAMVRDRLASMQTQPIIY